jgi:NDP-sugar pyrophosphorylase family protein
MRPATSRLPKALIPVNGRPFAEYQLEWLARNGVGRVVYCLGYLGGMIMDHVGDGGRWGLGVTYSDEADDLRGTAGAIRLALDAGLLDDGFFVLYADSFLPIDPAPVWEASGRGSKPLMTVYRNRELYDRSNVVFAEGRVQLYEKGRTDAANIGMEHIDYGLSVLTGETVREWVPPGGHHSLADLFHQLSGAGGLAGHEIFHRFYEIGSPQGLRDLEAFLAANTNLHK